MNTHLRTVRWIALGGGLVFCLWACISHPLTQPVPEPGQEVHAEVTIVPMRRLDLIFMIDNSQSMKPKQDKMREQFPRLIDALRDRSDNSLPDLRIAILDSDVGGGRGVNIERGLCTKSGDQWGDKGVFQMRDPAGCGVNENARWLELANGKPVNFEGNISDVFGCLASNVGVEGCGYEHQLSVFQWAFHTKENASQRDFLRPEAYLGIVILTDEDDCSAPPDTSMFIPRITGEGTSLRCATRSHQCDGAQLSFPMTGPVSVPYSSCRARTDESCDSKVDTTAATSCNPLTSVAELVAAVKGLKGGGTAADDKILVAAIYGTPRASDSTAPVYKIDLAPNPASPASAEIWDYWPICYDPAYPPSSTGFDQSAAEHGATGGLRIDAFLNAFPARNRRAYSICEPDFGPAMQGIGDALSNLMGDLCAPFKLVDTSDEPGLQADCRVAYRIPHAAKDASGNAITRWDEGSGALPRCDDSRTPTCWEAILGKADGTDAEKSAAKRCPAKGEAPSQMINIVRKPDDGLPVGTKAVMQCLACVEPQPGAPPYAGCDY